MFDGFPVVQSAVSAFNNAALAGPAFFWYGILALPLFFAARMFGGGVMSRVDLFVGARARTSAMAAVVMAMTFLWLVLMGGNWGVLRDATSTLPFCVAGLLFVTAAIVARASRGFLGMLPATRRVRMSVMGGVLLVALVAGISGVPTWWGYMMQAAAVFCGVALGLGMRGGVNPAAMSVVVMYAVAAVILMQPEFFRFGQLGALTLVHLGWLVLIAACAAVAVAVRIVRPRGRIHHSAYVKLKWLGRFVCALAVVIFVMTESVPVFLGMTAAFLFSAMMSVWHADKLPDGTADACGAAMMFLFGIMTVMPAVSALGVIYWASLPRDRYLGQMRRILL